MADLDDLRRKLERFYEKNNPEKAKDIDKMLELVQDSGMSEHTLFESLCKKYGVLYDPLSWKPPVIGRGTVNGAQVEYKGESTRRSQKSERSPQQPTIPSTTTAASTSPSLATSGQIITPPLPAGGGSNTSSANTELTRSRLTKFYERYNPTKLSDVPAILQLAEDTPDEEIIQKLCKKYNVPSRDVFKMLGMSKGDESSRRGYRGGGEGDPGDRDFKKQLQDARHRDEGEIMLRKEFSEWMSRVLSLDPPLDPECLFDRLSNGVVLCQLLHTLNPHVRFKYHTKPLNHFQELANVDAFLKACQKEFNVAPDQLFNPDDLVSGGEREERQVMTLFLHVAKEAHEKFEQVAPQIVKIEMEIEKEDEAVVSHEEVEAMMQKKAAEQRQLEMDAKQKAEAEQKAREAERYRREQEEEEARIEAAARQKAREEEERRRRREAEHERERLRKEEELRLMREQRKFEEEARLKREQQEREERFRRERAAFEEEQRRIAAVQAREKAERTRLRMMEAPGYEEDNPVFQYKNNKYIAERRDPLDVGVGKVVNSMKSAPAVRVHKVKHGTYVIEYPKRIVFHVRQVRDTIMIRVGGGWQSLEEFLWRRLKEYPEEVARFTPLRNFDGRDAVTYLHQNATRLTGCL